MRIAVTDTGRPAKQQQYLDWLRTFDPTAELVNISFDSSVQDLSGFDGLVLTGGEDVDPALSKAAPVELVEEFNRQRDDAEFRFLEQAMTMRMPILGICRGLQLTNVFLGGTLIADLPAAGYRPHTAAKDEPVLQHTVRVDEGTLLHQITHSVNGRINSYHHQAALQCGDGLRVSGRSEDGVTETLEWIEPAGRSPLLLVQWHPERMKEQMNPFTTAIGSFLFKEAQNYHSIK